MVVLDGRGRADSHMIWISEASGLHGIADVQALLDRVGEGGVLELMGFVPRPALSSELLRAAGLFVDDAEAGVLRVGRSPVPPLVDLRFREPPEPLHETLLAAERLAPGERWCARYPHYPAPLAPLLRAREVDHELTTRPDGTGILWMRRR